MKSRLYKLILIAGFSAVTAHAALTETSPGPVEAQSTWQKLTTTVKVKVEEWMNYWTGKPEQSTVATPNPTHAPAPVAAKTVGNGVAPDEPVTSAPADQTPAPTASTTAPASAQPVAAKTVGNGVAPVKPGLSDDNVALRHQKVVEHDAGGTSLSAMKALRESVRNSPLMKVSRPGRAGTSHLAKKDGVPVSDWKKVKVAKVVPRLDIGVETLVSKEDFTMSSVSFGAVHPAQMKRLNSPQTLASADLKKALAIKAAKTFGPKGLQANIRTVGKPVNHETIAKVAYEFKWPNEAKPLPYKPLTDDQLKMVAALILFERGDHCHMIMGLFHQLMADERTHAEASYYLGACAAKLKMSQVAFDTLSKLVAAEDKEFGAQALDLLAKDLPLIYEKDFYHLLKGVKSFKNLVSEGAQDAVAYRMAKGAYRAGDYKTSITYASRVNQGTEFYDEARFLSAMNSFALKDKPAALKKLQELSANLDTRVNVDHNMRALVSVNLARMYFGQKKYDKALESYMQVPKDHPLWVQALVEQGWTQLALEDNSGAIGNMYSLHSPYFRAVYQPESFVVRTIGYLNICQYGDAYRTLTELEKEYRDMYDKTQGYMSHKSDPLAVYSTVKTYIKGKSADNVEGVPYQIWREMARRKDFLNLQTALNDKQDEAHRYDGVNDQIKKEKAGIRWHAEQSKKRFDGWKAQIAKVKKDKSLIKNLADWQQNLMRERDLTIGYRFQLQILEQSRQGFLDFQAKAQKKLDTETAGLTKKAGQCLIAHAKQMSTQMSQVLDNNEFLRYEVFSGSGENIRYQVAGGAVGGNVNRLPASYKPTKLMNWNFDGEFWEDEIGSYRSSLQNVCPTAMTKQAKTTDDDN